MWATWLLQLSYYISFTMDEVNSGNSETMQLIVSRDTKQLYIFLKQINTLLCKLQLLAVTANLGNNLSSKQYILSLIPNCSLYHYFHSRVGKN